MILYQNSPEIEDPRARKSGCFVRSLLRPAELYTGRNFNAVELNKLFDRVLSLEFAHGDFIVDDPASIVKQGFLFRGEDRECYQTGLRRERDKKHNLITPVVTWWQWVEKNPVYKCVAFEIMKGWTVNRHAHYRLGALPRTETFDPYTPKPFIDFEIYQTYYWLGEAR